MFGAGEHQAVGQLRQRVQAPFGGRLDDGRVRHLVRVCLGDDGLDLAGRLPGLGDARFDAKLEPLRAAGEIPDELVAPPLDLAGHPLGCHDPREDPHKAPPGPCVAAPQELDPSRLVAGGRELLVRPLGELRRQFPLKEASVGAGLAQQVGECADQGIKLRVRVHHERCLVLLTGDVLPERGNGGSGKRFKVPGADCALHGAGDLLCRQAGSGEQVLIELPAHLAGIKPARVFDHGSQEIVHDEAIHLGPFELIRQEAGTCKRRVGRLKRQRRGKRPCEGDGEERRA